MEAARLSAVHDHPNLLRHLVGFLDKEEADPRLDAAPERDETEVDEETVELTSSASVAAQPRVPERPWKIGGRGNVCEGTSITFDHRGAVLEVGQGIRGEERPRRAGSD